MRIFTLRTGSVFIFFNISYSLYVILLIYYQGVRKIIKSVMRLFGENAVFRKITILTVICALAAAVAVLAVLNAGNAKKLSQETRRNSENAAAISSVQSRIKESEEKISSLETENSGLSEELRTQKQNNSSLEEQLASAQKAKSAVRASAVPSGGQHSELSSAAEGSRQDTAEQQAGKVCYLTFDDGPSENTLSILKTLDNYGVKATFFVVGYGELDYIYDISAAGHTVGLHSNTHNYASIYSSDAAFLSDLECISAEVEKRTGKRSLCMRFPGGSSNTASLTQGKCKGIMTRLTKKLPEMGYSYFDWNVSSGDAASGGLSAENIKSNVLKGASGKKNICVLMHDSREKTTTAEALPGIIEGLRSMGFSFEAVRAGSPGFHHNVGN